MMEITQISGLFLGLGYFVFSLVLMFRWAGKKTWTIPTREFHTNVSVIIPARNEGQNVEILLRHLSSQKYPRELFEVILVDDNSVDKTLLVAEECLGKSRIRGKAIKARGEGKKNAILSGIMESSGTWIVTTDADCCMGPEWLSAMVSYYEANKPEMIIGPVGFHRENGFWGKVQSLEFLSLSGITGGSALAGFPLMCNGANLAYSKKAFFEVGGFEGTSESPSGDDMMLLLKMKRKFPSRVKYLKSRDAIVLTPPQPNMAGFFNQRKRWVSKAKYYDDRVVSAVSWMVLIYCVSILVFFALFFVNKSFAEILVICLGSKAAIDFLFLFLTASFFEKKSLMWLFIPAEVLYLFYVPIISLAGLFGQFTWKGREFR